MNMRTVILVAFASTLVMTATVAHAGDPIPGVDVNLGKNPGGLKTNSKGTAPTNKPQFNPAPVGQKLTTSGTPTTSKQK